MAVIDFPNSPTVNQIHTHSGRSWSWDGTKWVSVSTTSLDAGLLTGTTMAPNVVNYPSHIVQRDVRAGMPNDPANEGGQIDLAPGTGYSNNLTIDRYQNTMRFIPGGAYARLTIADNLVAITSADDIDMRADDLAVLRGGGSSGPNFNANAGGVGLNPGTGRMYFGASSRSAYMPLEMKQAPSTADLAVTATSLPCPGATFAFNVCKTGDLIDLYGQANIRRDGAGADMYIACCVNGVNQWNSWWNPAGVNDRDTITQRWWYVVPSDGAYTITLTATCFSGAGKFTVLGATGGSTTYSTAVSAMLYGIR